MGLYVKDSNIWRESSNTFVKDAGIWYRLQSTYVKNSGIWIGILQPPIYKPAVDVGSTYFEFPQNLFIPGRGFLPYINHHTFDPNSPRGRTQTGLEYGATSETTFTVPSGVSQIRVRLWGAGGASGYASHISSGSGGGGGYVDCNINVTPGQVFIIRVGQGGSSPDDSLGGNQTGGGGYYDAFSTRKTWNFLSSIGDVPLTNNNTISDFVIFGAVGGGGGGFSGIFSPTLQPYAIAAGGGGGGGVGGFVTPSFSAIGAAGGAAGQAGSSGNLGNGLGGRGGGAGSLSIGGAGGPGVVLTDAAGPSGGNGSFLRGGAGGNGNVTSGTNATVGILRGGSPSGGFNGGGHAGCSRRYSPGIVLSITTDGSGGGGGGYFGGGGGSAGAGGGGGGGGGGSNYVNTSLVAFTNYNLNGSGRFPGDVISGLTPAVTLLDRSKTTIYTSGTYKFPGYDLLQGGVGFGGDSVPAIAGYPPQLPPPGGTLYTEELFRNGRRGENGLVIIDW